MHIVALITIAMAITVTATLILLVIDLTLIRSERALDNIKPEQMLNDIINGSISEKIRDEINTLTKQINNR